MSTQFNLHNNHLESNTTQGKVRVTDLLGRPSKESKNKLLFYIYNDGSVERKLIKQ